MTLCANDKRFFDLLRRNGVLVVGVMGKLGSGKTTLVDTLCGEFEWRVKCHSRNFADALKEQISHHFNIPLSWFYTREGKARVIEPIGATVGSTLQTWGTGLRNSVSSDVWLIALRSWLERLVDEIGDQGDVASGASGDYTALLTRNPVPVMKRTERSSEQWTTEEDWLGFPPEDGVFCDYYRPRAIVFVGDVRFPNEFEFVRETCGGVLVRTWGDPSGLHAAQTNRDTKHVSETALDDEESFYADIEVCTDDETPLECADNVVSGLYLYSLALPYRDRFVVFYRTRLRPLIDAIVEAREQREGAPFDVHSTGKLLFDNAFGDDANCALIFRESNLISPAVRWLELQRYVEWLGAKADSRFLRSFIASWHVIFARTMAFRRFLHYASL